MKLYNKLMMVGAVLAATASCTDLNTDLHEYSQLPDNPIAVEGEFNGCYRYLHGWFGRDFYEGVVYQGDEVMGCCFGMGNYYDDGRYLNGSIHSIHLDDWRAKAGMEAALNGITYTNKKIAAYGGEGYPEKLDPIVAPLRAIRAYYHFWLMELYGDVPILDRVIEEGQPIERMPRAQVAEFLEKELLEILQEDGGLSKANDASTYGKPNYWMAAALLAKIYLNWGVYTNDITTVTNDTPNPKLNDCVYWCDQIINSGLFEVGYGYRQKFYPDNGVHIKDFIYALDVDPATKPDGTTTWHRWFGFKKESMCRPLPFTINFNSYKSIAGQTVLTKEAVERFNLPGDERNIMVLQGPQTCFDVNFNPTDEPVIIYKDVDNPSKSHIQLNYVTDFDFDDASIYSLGDESTPALTQTNVTNGTALANIQKGARLFKYPAREIDYQLYERQQANDTPIFRFADILLMKAECLLRGATPTLGQDAQSLFNVIRACSSAPMLDHKPTYDDILDERSREFILEPWRRNDLIRFGRFEDDWGQKNRYKKWTNEDHTTYEWVEREGVKDPNRRLMPIHRDLLNTNTNWRQNPGYKDNHQE